MSGRAISPASLDVPNLVFTYPDEPQQQKILADIIDTLLPDGFLIIGIHETLPQGEFGLKPYNSMPGIYQKTVS